MAKAVEKKLVLGHAVVVVKAHSKLNVCSTVMYPYITQYAERNVRT